MKQYLLFFGHDYYPSGGWSDLHSSYDTEDQAFHAALELATTEDQRRTHWWHVVDTENMQVCSCHRNDGMKQ